MKMPDAPSKKRWDAENTKTISVKLMRKSDQDVIDFFEGKNKRDTLCMIVREYIANHPDENA